ncbi:MAG: hypothetical protein ACI39R_04170 [Lachnospiraceae bacterium]
MKKIRVINVFVYLFGIIAALLVVLSIFHPRPQNISTALFMTVMTVMCIRWKNQDKFQSKDEYKASVKEYKKRKKAAEKEGIAFDESEPVQSKKFFPSEGSIFAAAVLGGLMAFYLGSFISPFFPKHMLYEYKSDIAKLKESGYYDYSFFPDEIPQEATEVSWIVCPSLMQGSGYEFLGFKASEEYIQNVIDTYCGDANIIYHSEDSYEKKFFDNLMGDYAHKAVEYELYNNGDWNHSHSWGIVVSENKEYIGFYCE